MTFTLELTPEQEARLREDAAREGVDPAALLLSRAGLDTQEAIVEEGAALALFARWQAEAERFRQWADSHVSQGPGLFLEDMSRESIYGEHG